MVTGADISICSSNFRSNHPLHHAAQKGHIEIMAVLFRNGAAVDALNNTGHASLHLPAFQGDHAVMEIMSATGAINLSVRSHAGDTPLHIAACCGCPNFVSTLLDNGAEKYTARNNG